MSPDGEPATHEDMELAFAFLNAVVHDDTEAMEILFPEMRVNDNAIEHLAHFGLSMALALATKMDTSVERIMEEIGKNLAVNGLQG